jgi:predicted RND superfamily exporter protein
VRTPDGEFLTFAYTYFTGLNADTFREHRLRAERVDPGATGFANFVEAAVYAPWTKEVLVGVLALVLLVLAIDQRNWRWMLLALLPVTFGSAVTFGVMCWLDVGFSVMLVLVVPLLIGLGVDDGIHVVHRMREDEELPPDVATCSVGRAIVMTTLTTCASFSVMMFSNHPGMESMALCLICGLPLCLLASVTLIPAGSVLLGLRRVRD